MILLLIVVAFVVGGFAGLLVGLGLTVGIITSVLERIPPHEGVARTLLAAQLRRFGR